MLCHNFDGCDWVNPHGCLLADCPSTYFALGASCYKMMIDYVYWHEARDICAANNGYLARIDNAAENDYLISLFDSGSVPG